MSIRSLVLMMTLATPALAADRTAAGTAFVTSLAAGKYDEAAKTFAKVMADAMSAKALGDAWTQVQGSVGHFKAIEGTRISTQNSFDLVLVRCAFEKSVLDAKLVYDGEGKLSGLWFVPSGEASAYSKPGTATPLAPAAKAPAGVREVEVVVGAAGKWPLPGTLSLPEPKGKVPAVVLVHGSGPNDRDESVGGVKPFRDLAWGLAARGVAVLRYEKRTHAHAARLGEVMDSLTVKDETIDDAVAAAALLRTRPEIDPAKVVVLGHSLGGYLAPRIGAADPKLAGLVVLAGTSRPLEVVILDQTKYLATLKALDPKAKAQLDFLEKEAAKVPLVDAKSTGKVMGAPVSYWLDLKGYDPVGDAKKLKLPIFVAQGGRDYQVTAPDWAGWKKLEGEKRITLKHYPALNHLFVSGTAKSTPEEYAAEGHVAPEVIDDVAAWVKAR